MHANAEITYKLFRNLGHDISAQAEYENVGKIKLRKDSIYKVIITL